MFLRWIPQVVHIVIVTDLTGIIGPHEYRRMTIQNADDQGEDEESEPNGRRIYDHLIGHIDGNQKREERKEPFLDDAFHGAPCFF